MNPIVAHWLFFVPVRLLRGEPILQSLSFVRNFRMLDRTELCRVQFELLKAQVTRTYDKIPFYRNSWNSMLGKKGQVTNLQDFSALPVIEKKDVQENSRLLASPEIKKFDVRATSGSTGTPLQFIKDRRATAFMDAVMYDAYSWYGINLGDRQARFWGMPHDKKNKTIARLKDFLMNRKRLSAFQLSQVEYQRFADLLKSWRPHYCYGYPSLLCEFAGFILSHDIDLASLRMKAVICTGEELKEQQKKLLGKTFHCPVVNEYGCTEVGVIGFECAYGNMHEMSPNIYFEILKGGQPVLDQEGEVVVTELHAQTSPFIRYKTGDRGIRSSSTCSCGLPYPVIKILSGRIDDYILTPDGRKVYDAILAYTLKKGIKKFKAVQRDTGMLEIMIVPDQGLTGELLEIYEKKLKEHISSEMQFIFTKVENIPQERSGKLRYFRSEIH